jgi:hypothetical protein
VEYWLKRGFTIKGTGNPKMWVVSRNGRHAVVTVDFWDNWERSSEWFGTVERALSEAKELATV